jgi:D-alanyl-D-alanine carboxypeptidase
VRAIHAAELLEKGFAANPLSWLIPSYGKVENLQPVNVDPPDLHEEVCGKHRRRQAAESEDDSEAVTKLVPNSPFADFFSSLRAPNANQNLFREFELGEPVVVFTGTSPKKPPVSKTAAVQASKAGDATADKPASKGVGARRPPALSGLSSAPLADNPRPELAASSSKGTDKPAPVSKTAAVPDGSNTPAKPAQKTAGKTAVSKPRAVPPDKPAQDAPQKTSNDPGAR